VAKGEGLLQIARKYYGPTATMQKADDIYAANRDVMKSKSDLRPGMQLKIPQ
jgi:nucleoid-associated protein YgaU